MNKFFQRPDCPICGAQGLTVHRREFRDEAVAAFLDRRAYPAGFFEDVGEAGFELRRCDPCAFLWQVYVLTPSFEHDLYEKYLDMEHSQAKKVRAPMAYRSATFREVLFAGLFFDAVPADLDVLEVGMGWGFWTLAAAAAGYNAFGLELSPRKVAFARERGVRVLSDLTDHRGRFHYVHSEGVIEHINDLGGFVSSVSEAVRVGGIFYISVPDASRLTAKLPREGWRPNKRVYPLEHVNGFSNRSLVRLMERHGFEPLGTRELVANGLRVARSLGWHPSLREILRGHRAGTNVFFRKTAPSIGSV